MSKLPVEIPESLRGKILDHFDSEKAVLIDNFFHIKTQCPLCELSGLICSRCPLYPWQEGTLEGCQKIIDEFIPDECKNWRRTIELKSYGISWHKDKQRNASSVLNAIRNIIENEEVVKWV